LIARSSEAPAQPTKKRYSTSSGIFCPAAMTGTSSSMPFAHCMRASPAMPHGLPVDSTLLSMPVASRGKRDSIITWCRRMSMIMSTCSMSTGHS
jgi:hypothetical protein